MPDLIPKPDAKDAIDAIPPVNTDAAQLKELSMIPVAPKTTEEQDKVSAAQRGFNTTWENTQAYIAKSVITTTCVMVIIKIIVQPFFVLINVEIPAEWWTVVGLVIGFYFGRTNHWRQGDK